MPFLPIVQRTTANATVMVPEVIMHTNIPEPGVVLPSAGPAVVAVKACYTLAQMFFLYTTVTIVLPLMPAPGAPPDHP
ncbi:hypothetical protein [Streptomyces sp. NPDC056690]|uniref:hypothetical protein n=1 Tax=unclassified Streptomyces TaxID=2593676 RepID=UPI00363C631D